MKSILENSTPEFEDSMLEFHKYFLEKQNVSTYLHARQVETANNYLLEYAQTLPAKKAKHLADMVKTIDLSDNAYIYNQKLMSVIDKLNLEPKERFNVLKNVTSFLKDSSDYLSIFKIPDVQNMSIRELASIFAEKIFRYSVVQFSKVSKIQDDYANNQILSCSRCERSASKNLFAGFIFRQSGI